MPTRLPNVRLTPWLGRTRYRAGAGATDLLLYFRPTLDGVICCSFQPNVRKGSKADTRLMSAMGGKRTPA